MSEIPDDDLDVDEMGSLELQRERLKIQRALARAAIDQTSSLRRLERTSLTTMIAVLSGGVVGIVRDPPQLQDVPGAAQVAMQVLAWILRLN